MKKKWKCPRCGIETIGYGIYSHRQKHERKDARLSDIQRKYVESFEISDQRYRDAMQAHIQGMRDRENKTLERRKQIDAKLAEHSSLLQIREGV